MPFKKSKRKPVRIESEESQAWSTPAKVKKLTAQNQRERDLRNRIHELEQQIAKYSRGDRFTVSTAVTDAITALTKTGFYGATDADTASQILTRAVREERWL